MSGERTDPQTFAPVVWLGTRHLVYSPAAGSLAMPMLGIRDAWDLATWLTYHRKG